MPLELEHLGMGIILVNRKSFPDRRGFFLEVLKTIGLP